MVLLLLLLTSPSGLRRELAVATRVASTLPRTRNPIQIQSVHSHVAIVKLKGSPPRETATSPTPWLHVPQLPSPCVCTLELECTCSTYLHYHSDSPCFYLRRATCIYTKESFTRRSRAFYCRLLAWGTSNPSNDPKSTDCSISILCTHSPRESFQRQQANLHTKPKPKPPKRKERRSKPPKSPLPSIHTLSIGLEPSKENS